MYACIIRETFVLSVFRGVFHPILKLELCRHACRRQDQIIPTCRYGKMMYADHSTSTNALQTSRAVLTRASSSRRVDLHESWVDLFSKRIITFRW